MLLVPYHRGVSKATPDGPSTAQAEPGLMATLYVTYLQHRGAESLTTFPCCDGKVAQELSSSSAPSFNMGEVENMPVVGPGSLPSQSMICTLHTGPRHLCFGSFFSSRKTSSALWLG